MNKVLLWFTAIMYFFTIDGYSQTLKRRGFLGVQVQARENNPNTSYLGGVKVGTVFPNGTAEILKIQPGDIVLKINDAAANNTQDFVAMVSRLKEGDNVAITLLRNEKTLTMQGKLKGVPMESDSANIIIYDEVKLSNNGLTRSIIKRPKTGTKLPAVFFMQGFSCSSIDNLPPDDSQKKLIDGLVQRGYVVFRMEKPGMGDSYGTPPCKEIDFKTEENAFLAGLRKLKQYSFVDAENIFLFGHSLGGTTAPLIAANEKVKGIIAYGITDKPWLEYFIDLYRKQLPLTGTDYIQVDEDMRDLVPFLNELLIAKKHPSELVKQIRYRPFLERIFRFDGKDQLVGRHYTFLQQLQDIPISKAWRDANAYTLAIYGEADIQALDSGSVKAVETLVNNYHPGKAKAYILPRTDHGFIEVGTKQDAINLRANGQYDKYAAEHFNTKLIDLLDAWIKDKLAKI